jgi:hypothetical protein
MTSIDPQIWRRVASFLLAAETAALQNTCKTLLQRPMPYFFEQLSSMSKVTPFHLANRVQSMTVQHATGAFTSGDLATAILLCRQIPVQIRRMPLRTDGSTFDHFVLDEFLLSACAKNITFLADDGYYGGEKGAFFFRHLLQYPNVGRVFLNAAFLWFIVKRRNIADERLCMRELHLVDAIRDYENLSFLLSRLDESSDVTVKLCSYQHFVATAQQIIDFCATVVSKFTSRPSKILHFSISASINNTNENYEAAFDSVDKMMQLPNRTGKVVLYANPDRTFLVRAWE